MHVSPLPRMAHMVYFSGLHQKTNPLLQLWQPAEAVMTIGRLADT